MRNPNDNLKYNLMCHLSILTDHCSIVLSISLLIRSVTVTKEFGNFFQARSEIKPTQGQIKQWKTWEKTQIKPNILKLEF